MGHEIPDLELIARCVSGSDEAAWELFVHRFGRLIWSAIHRTFRATNYCYTAEDAEDLFNSVLLSLVENDFRSLRQFEARNACSVASWLTVVAARRTVDHMRRSRSHLQQSLEDLPGPVLDGLRDDGENVERMLMQQQQRGVLDRSVGMLSPDDRSVFELLFRQGLSPESAARSLGISASALYTRKHRLLDRMKKILQDL